MTRISCKYDTLNTMYHIAGKFGEFGKSSMIRQTKPSKLVLTINNLLADPLIRQTFFCQMLEMSHFAKHSPTKLCRYIVHLYIVTQHEKIGLMCTKCMTSNYFIFQLLCEIYKFCNFHENCHCVLQ